MNHYNKDRDNIALGKWYTDHVSAMTREGLHAKSDIASELAFRDKQIAERDETIRKLRDPVAVHVAMLRGEIAVPPLAELLHVYGATFSGLDVANVEIVKGPRRSRQVGSACTTNCMQRSPANTAATRDGGETETAAEVRRADYLGKNRSISGMSCAPSLTSTSGRPPSPTCTDSRTWVDSYGGTRRLISMVRGPSSQSS